MYISNEHYLIVDLEATCSEDGTLPAHEMEIIEIGAVILNARIFQVESEFQSFVRPVRHPHLTPFCIELTGITQEDVSTAPRFPEVVKEMQVWMYAFPDTLFCSWGEFDREQFLADCQFHNVGYPFRSGHFNLKVEFRRAAGQKKKLGLAGALRSLGMEFEGSPHRALDDARNAARIVSRVCVNI